MSDGLNHYVPMHAHDVSGKEAMSEAKEGQQVASYKMQSALLEIKGYADRGEKIYPRTILMLWKQEGLAEAINKAALAAAPLPSAGVREAAAPSLKCSCQPIHSQACVFRDARSASYRHFYPHEAAPPEVEK